MLWSPFSSPLAFNEILLLENWLEWIEILIPLTFHHGNVHWWELLMVGPVIRRHLYSAPYNNESHQMLKPAPRARGSNFKVFDHLHLRNSSGSVWLLKFSSLLPHLSIATEAQNSHLGYSFFFFFSLPPLEEQANIDCRTAAPVLRNCCWRRVVISCHHHCPTAASFKDWELNSMTNIAVVILIVNAVRSLRRLVCLTYRSATLIYLHVRRVDGGGYETTHCASYRPYSENCSEGNLYKKKKEKKCDWCVVIMFHLNLSLPSLA